MEKGIGKMRSCALMGTYFLIKKTTNKQTNKQANKRTNMLTSVHPLIWYVLQNMLWYSWGAGRSNWGELNYLTYVMLNPLAYKTVSRTLFTIMLVWLRLWNYTGCVCPLLIAGGKKRQDK
jgi:hypothetical protein